jgi:pimeloyl-ACP methyl ester carboxylesterase
MKQIMIFFALTALCLNSCNNNGSKNGNNITMADSISFKSGYSEVNGLKMYYEIHGDKGNNLVLIHGGGSTIGTSFGKVLPELAKNFTVIALELQGHGHTNDRDAPESFEQDADDVVALLHNLDIPRASFLGFSNGGNTAIQIAVRHPEIVNKLILASTFYKREGLLPGFFDGMKQATFQDMPQVLRDAFLQINPDSSKLISMFNKDRERMLNFTDWKDEMLRSIKAPALIICGDRDVILPEHTVAMSKLIVDSRLMILPAEHGSYMGAAESPQAGNNVIELTAGIITDFLNK